jgi:hypothetical protein
MMLIFDVLVLPVVEEFSAPILDLPYITIENV